LWPHGTHEVCLNLILRQWENSRLKLIWVTVGFGSIAVLGMNGISTKLMGSAFKSDEEIAKTCYFNHHSQRWKCHPRLWL
jgi:hypothetical protein